jgi:hypothetical protein
MTPEIDITTYLNNTVSSLTSGTSLFHGGMLQPDSIVSELAVFVMPTGGAMPRAMAGSDDAEHYATVQIYIRGTKNDYPTAIALARTVYDALQYASLPGYIECRLVQSGPIYLGLDKDGRHAITINCELIYHE